MRELDLTYGYDENGLVTSVVDDDEGIPGGAPDGSFTFGYDHRNRLSWNERGGTKLHYSYDTIGNLSSGSRRTASRSGSSSVRRSRVARIPHTGSGR